MKSTRRAVPAPYNRRRAIYLSTVLRCCRKPLALTALLLCVLLPARLAAQNVQHSKNSQDLGLRHDFSVDPVSLSLNIQITLGSYKGRGDATMPAALRYSSKLWRLDFSRFVVGGAQGLPDDNNYTELDAVYGDPDHDRMTAGWSSTMEMPYVITTAEWFTILGEPCDFGKCGDTGTDNNKIMRVRLHMPDGSTHELRADDNPHPPSYNPYPLTFYAVDNSRLVYKVLGVVNGGEQAVTYMPDGSRYVTSNNGFTGSYIDRNGNTLNFDGTSWTDAMGRSVSLTDMPGINDTSVHVTYESRQLKVAGHPELSALTNFDDTLGTRGTWNGSTNNSPGLFGSGSAADRINSGGVFNPSVLYRIALADGGAYTFTYNVYGEIDKIVYPTGGYERFEFDAVPGVTAMNSPYTTTNRGVKRRFVSPDGTAAGEQPWDYNAVEVSQSVLKTVVVAPDGTVTERFIHRGLLPGVKYFDFDEARSGMVFEERFYAPGPERGQKGPLLRRKLTKWAAAAYVRQGIVPGGYVVTSKPRVTREVEVILDQADAQADVLARASRYAYDDDLNVTSQVEYGFVRVSRQSADAGEGQPSSVDSFPDGAQLRKSETVYLVNDPGISAATKQSYRDRNLISLATSAVVKDAADNVVSQTLTRYDETGDYPTVSCPGIANWTDPQTGARGNATTLKNWVNTDNTWVEAHARYDQAGNVREARDAHLDTDASHGRVTEHVYTSAYQYIYPEQTKTPAPDLGGVNGSTGQLISSNTYDPNSGLLLTSTDASGQITRYYYEDDEHNIDPLNRLRKVAAPDGGWTSYEYGSTPFGYYVRTRAALDASHSTDAYQYLDGLGRASRSYSRDGSAPDRTWVATKTTYDNMGRAAATSNPQFRLDLNDFTPAAVTTNEYDHLGRVKKLTTPDGSQITTAYDAYLTANLVASRVTVTDQAGSVRGSVSDALGRIVKVIEAPDVASYNYETAYEYDALGNLRKVIQGKAGQTQQTRNFSYDSLSRLTSSDIPEAGTATYSYNPDGSLKTKVDARHMQTNYVYDALSRVTKRGYTIETGHQAPPNYVASPDVNYFYDGTGMPEENGSALPTPLYSAGRLTAVKSSVSETIYTEFDVNGRVKKHRQVVDPGSASERKYLMEYGYDLAGNLVSEKYPSGKIVVTAYDAAGRTAGVKNQATGAYYAGGAAADDANRIRYTAHGAVEAIRLGNGLWEETQFNNRLQPGSIKLGTAAGSADRWQVAYGYGGASENNGNVRTQTLTVPTLNGVAGFTAVQTYTYDPVNRLDKARENRNTAAGQEDWRQKFTYDQFGNRGVDGDPSNPASSNTTVALIGPNPSVGQLNNRINAPGYGYDGAGNLVTSPRGGGSVHCDYDGENRMVAFRSDVATEAAYAYDGDGARVRRVVFTAAGQTTTVYVHDVTGRLVAEYSNEAQGAGGTSYLTQDHLGSTRVVTAQNQSVKSRHDYLPFGEELKADLVASGRATSQAYEAVAQAAGIRQKFTGYERDDETGLDFAEARYYSSAHGRFTSPDPLMGSAVVIRPKTWNRYAYVLNNPLRLIDPNGLAGQNPQDGAKVTSAPLPEGSVTLTIIYGEMFDETPPAPNNNSGASAPNVIDTVADTLADFFKGIPVGVAGGMGGWAVGIGPQPTDSLANRIGQAVGDVAVGVTSGQAATGGIALSATGGGAVVGVPMAAVGALGVVSSIVNAINIVVTPIQMSSSTLEPGPHAGESIPARGPGRDFTPEERQAINKIGRETGCHTCGSTDPGTKSGNFIPDHQPANKLNPKGKSQRLYPHCLGCSKKQGGEVRTATRRQK